MASKFQFVKEDLLANRIRTTFGVIDPETGEKYPDIINSYLIHALLDTSATYGYNTIVVGNKTYWLTMDKVLRVAIQNNGGKPVNAIVSIQERTDMLIAVARLNGISK